MNNIIANLRRDRPLSWENRLEAADEIFRLREENARLRNDLRNAIFTESDYVKEIERQDVLLREENERLREALDGLQEIVARKYEIGTEVEVGDDE